MTDTFFQFILETTRENFMHAQQIVTAHEEYSPYSNDLGVMEEYLEQGNFQQAVEYNNINTLLSPRAHLYKNYAFEKLGREKEATSELILARKIMEGLSLTGDGSKEQPYFVTRVNDERDMLRFFQEEFARQALLETDDRVLDLITCESGREIYFDITVPYRKMQLSISKAGLPADLLSKIKKAQRKWWQFWR